MKKILSLAVLVTLLSGTAAWEASAHPMMGMHPAPARAAMSMHEEFRAGGVIGKDTAQTAILLYRGSTGVVVRDSGLSAPMEVGSCNGYDCQ